MGSIGAETKGQTWLQKLDEQLNVDVDWMDPTYSKNLQIKPNDQTSNNLWVSEISRDGWQDPIDLAPEQPVPSI